MADNFMNSARVAELWTAIKTALAGKADLSALEGYTTPDAVATAITTALTGYATNAGVQAAIAAALASYMTSAEVDAAIAQAVAEAAHISFRAVDELPATGEVNVIYLVPNGGGGSNARDEYMWVDGKWEKLGSTEIDLTGYWAKADLTAMTAAELQAILV